MKRYLVGHVYMGGAIDDLVPCDTLKEAYEIMMLDVMKSDDKFEEDEWREIEIGRIKDYWTHANHDFIIDLKYKKK